jgi:anti-sigma factor RsiW
MRPLQCHEVAERLHQREDGRLSGAEGAALAEHLVACATCHERAAQFDGAAERLRHGLRAPAGFSDRVMARVSAERPRSRGSVSETARPNRIWYWLPATAAATLLLVLGLARMAQHRPSTRAPVDAARVEVELGLADVKARSVAAAGDFNDWQAVQMKKGQDGVWRVRLSLQPGRYQYSFVVDGEKWIADPRAATLVSSGYGGQNSVLDISL